MNLVLLIILSMATLIVPRAFGASADALFRQGVGSFRAGDYAAAIESFRDSANLQPSSGTLQNLGRAEWQRGQTGAAILAWEQTLWVDPLNRAAQGNLRFARKTAQLEAPELVWHEVVSTWLPVNWWAWISGLSFWLAVAAAMLPGILRWRRAGWHQAVAALGFTVFLLSLPAQFGVHSRSRLGFVLEKNSPLRLTPTQEAQWLTRLPAGEPARLEAVRGKYVLIRTNRSTGWVEKNQFGLISPVGSWTRHH
jgi:hypothetical protein